jgi:heterodisulfide reductase subunit C
MAVLSSIIFISLLLSGGILFTRRVKAIRRNILLGREIPLNNNRPERFRKMIRVAFAQGKMGSRPVAAFFHFIIYIGFILINLEVLEIIIDGITGTHRVLSILGPFYNIMIGFFELLAAGVIIACIVFLARRNLIKIPRFHLKEMKAWPSLDANIILVVEVLLMLAFLSMNAADSLLQAADYKGYPRAGSFPISSLLQPLLDGLSPESLAFTERFMWWFHITGIMAFLVYVTYSKHFHIVLSFPAAWFSSLYPKGRLGNMSNVTREVRLMLDPSSATESNLPETDNKFGASDVVHLSWKQLMDAYTCTECGRCSSVCPANQTGKLLSPRKILMDTRDRIEEVGKIIDREGSFQEDGKTLLRDFISEEEIWACTTCNACTQACPINLDPLSIIIDLRRHLIMEESKSPESITSMFNNIENNGAPWAFSAADRANWTNE